MDQPLSHAPPTPSSVTPRRGKGLVIYAVGLTVAVLGFLGWYIWQGLPATSCPRPKTVQYSYDDPRDHLGPFLAAIASHDTHLARRYYVPGISKSDRATLESVREQYQSMPLSIDGWQGQSQMPWSDIADPVFGGQKLTRLTWTTENVDGCWRVRRVDQQQITVGVEPTVNQ